MKRLLLAGLCLASVLGFAAEKVKLNDNSRVALVGDSITEQKSYTRQLETYLTACAGLKNVDVFQFGWGGEQAGGCVARMENDILPWKPTIVTILYGMNDGRYRSYDEKIANNYESNLRKIAKFFQKNKVDVVLASPQSVDRDTFQRGNKKSALVYNDTLTKLGERGKKVADSEKTGFADVNKVMNETMAKAKAEYGEKYPVCGGDGVHPHQNGHLLMTYALLEALGIDGKIAEIEMDFASGKANASSGHKVLSAKPGELQLESIRYPYCFAQNPGKNPNNPASILPFIDFQERFNNFKLEVKNLPSGKAEVQWGNQKKVFTADQLKKGINLAAEFTVNPFSANFNKIYNLTGVKQNFETWAVKNLITQKRNLKRYQMDKKLDGDFAKISSVLLDRQAEYAKQVQAAHVPVKHVIKVTPVK